MFTNCIGYDKALTLIYVTDLNDNDININITSNTPVTTIGSIAVENTGMAGAIKPYRQVEADIGIKEFLARPRLIVSSNMTSTYTADAFILWRAIPSVGAMVNQWGYFRGDLVLTISYTGSSSVMGLYRLVFTPDRVQPVDMPLVPLTVYSSEHARNTSLPHVDIDMSMPANHVIRLPFPQSTRYMTPGDNDWIITTLVVNPETATSGATAPTLNYSIYASYENIEFNHIIPQSGEAPNENLSGLLAYASRLAAVVPSSLANPASKALMLGSSIAKYFGYSKPHVAAQKAVFTQPLQLAYASGQPNFFNGISLDPSVVKPGGIETIPLHEKGDTTFEWLVSKSVMVVADTDPATGYVVIPGVCSPGNAVLQICPTPTAFACSMFKYWTGNLTVCVQIVSNPLIRWRIGIAIIPPFYNVPATFPTNGSYLTHIIEVAGTTCTDIDIPYLYAGNFELFKFITALATNNHETRIAWYSLTTPTGPDVSINNPFVNLWIKGAKNLSVGYPSLGVPNNYIIAQSGIGLPSEATFGEIVDDLNLLTRRSGNQARYVSTATTGYLAVCSEPLAPVRTPVIGGTATVSANNWTYVSYLGSAYFGWHGSINHYMIFVSSLSATVGSTCTNTTTVVPGGLTNLTYDNSSEGVTFSSNSAVLNLNVPDRSPALFRFPHSGVDTTTYSLITQTVEINMTGSGAAMTFVDLISAGDDYVTSGFLTAPRLELR